MKITNNETMKLIGNIGKFVFGAWLMYSGFGNIMHDSGKYEGYSLGLNSGYQLGLEHSRKENEDEA